jgi:hypothetical protein
MRARCCGSVSRLIAELKRVQEFVLHLGEVGSDDPGGFLVGDHLPEPEEFQEGDSDEPRHYKARRSQGAPEERRARRRAEMAEILQ